MNGSTWAGVGAIGLWAFLAPLNRAAAGLPPLQLTAMAFAVSAACGIGWLAAAGRLDAAWLVERGTMEGQRVARLADLADGECPYFAIVLVHGQGRRPGGRA